MAYTAVDKSTDYFNTVTWTGDGTSSRDITGVGFQPDFTWIKQRNGTFSHVLGNSVSGDNKFLTTNGNSAESTDSTKFRTFVSDGFQVGSHNGVNGSSNTYVGWSWLGGGTASSNTDGSVTSNVSANTTSGFSICTFTATGSSMTFGHGLGVAPNLVIWKRRDSSTNGDWATSSDSQGWTNYMTLNNTTANQSGSTRFGSAPTSSVVTVGAETVSSGTYVAYCFASKKGFSKFGSYEGNGNSNGTFIHTGFKPAFVITKRIDTGGDNWHILDSTRDIDNPAEEVISANSSSAEGTTVTSYLDFLSNGFKCRGTGSSINTDGLTYLYIAFAESPFVTSTGIPTTAR